MKFTLDDYIEKYIRNAKYTTNKKIARHLREIIPQTTHLHPETFKEIIEELKMKMDNGENFKNAFQKKGNMSQSKQEVIDIILSFSYEELKNWIWSRLHGGDDYFSIYEGYETNLCDFLADAFHHIKNKTFRESFLEILDSLVSELRKYSPKEVEQDKDYIYELLSLCGSIKEFNDKNTLYKLAKSGKFKPFKLRDTDLHLVLLTTLLSYRIGGNYRFWIEQMQDDSNKYYTNAAFYALLEQGFKLDILFEHIEKFIDRFKGGIELVFGIEALFDYHEPKKIYSMFKKIESRLSKEQKEAVNNAFKEAGYDPVYEPDAAAEKEVEYIPVQPQLEWKKREGKIKDASK
jgi:hypothetical protein